MFPGEQVGGIDTAQAASDNGRLWEVHEKIYNIESINQVVFIFFINGYPVNTIIPVFSVTEYLSKFYPPYHDWVLHNG